jgi:hypothetical protein
MFSGDFLMAGRLLIDDTGMAVASARRLVDFVQERPVAAILGGHVELNNKGELFDWGSQYHPHERPLPLDKQDLLRLPAALAKFNGFYTDSGGFVMINQMHVLVAAATAAVIFMSAMLVGLWRLLRRFRRLRLQ